MKDYKKIEDVVTDEELDMLDLAFGLTDTSRLGCQVRNITQNICLQFWIFCSVKFGSPDQAFFLALLHFLMPLP